MANIQDVAALAGVSVATVSRVLNNSTSVVPGTRDRVLSAIRELNYNPNLTARNLRRAQTKMVLVLLPTVANPFYSRIVKGMEDIAHKNGYNVMLCNTNSDPAREKVYLELLKNRLADGAVLMSSDFETEYLMELGSIWPIVQCCEYNENTTLSRISINNEQAAYKAVEHLTKLGHKRIGMISAKNNFISTALREKGYKRALSDAGIALDPGFIMYGDYGYKSGLRLTTQLLSLENPPSALFAISDMMAIGGIKAAIQKGFSIPDDFAAVGFDNISFSSMYSPALTTISQPKYDMGCVAMELLLKGISGEETMQKTIVLEHELIIRESTVN